jgi:archaellum component FlaG (FlaF/FlaG flagellin family)
VTLAAVVIVASIFAILHHRTHHSVVAAQVVAQKTATLTASEIIQPQNDPTQITISPNATPEYESSFVALAETEVSQLREGMTLVKPLLGPHSRL